MLHGKRGKAVTADMRAPVCACAYDIIDCAGSERLGICLSQNVTL